MPVGHYDALFVLSSSPFVILACVLLFSIDFCKQSLKRTDAAHVSTPQTRIPDSTTLKRRSQRLGPQQHAINIYGPCLCLRSSLMMSTPAVRSRPQMYSPRPFHIVRAIAFVSAAIVSGILIYFCLQLKHDGFKLPWVFIIVSLAHYLRENGYSRTNSP